MIAVALLAGVAAMWTVNVGGQGSAAAKPPRPGGLAAASGDGRVLLTWSATDRADFYRIFVDGAPVARSRTTTFPVLDLVNGRTYEFSVRAVNDDGVSPLAAPVKARPTAGASSSPANLAWFYKPPNHSDAPRVLAEFDTYILSRGDESFLARVRAERPSTRVLQYFLLNQIIKPRSGGVEQRNNAAYLPGDFDLLWSQHPDWFLHDGQGRPVVEGGKYYRMDPGNQEWRAFWVQRVKAANVKWDGVFADNLDLGLAGLHRLGIDVPSYPTSESYTDALAGFVSYIHTELSQVTGKPFVANLVNGGRGSDARAKYLDYLDGAMEEGWALGWSSDHLGVDAWTDQLASVDELTAKGKSAILVAQGAQEATDRQAFAYASYLLVAGPKVSFRYTQTGSYGSPWLFATYDVPLGRPLGRRYRLPDGTLRRDFTKGCVVVNPDLRTVSILHGSCSPAGIPSEAVALIR